jgi:hypothetical protein
MKASLLLLGLLALVVVGSGMLATTKKEYLNDLGVGPPLSLESMS